MTGAAQPVLFGEQLEGIEAAHAELVQRLGDRIEPLSKAEELDVAARLAPLERYGRGWSLCQGWYLPCDGTPSIAGFFAKQYEAKAAGK